MNHDDPYAEVQDDDRRDDPDALAALLPFYVNGRLDARQRARIDAALETMPALRVELAEIRALQAQVVQAGEHLHVAGTSPSPARLGRLMSRIAAEAPPPAGEAPPDDAGRAQPAIDLRMPRPRVATRVPDSRARLATAIAAGLAIVCLVQGAMLHRRTSGQGDRDGEYASLSGASDDAPATGVRFTVRFSEHASWSDIQGLCEQLRLRIVRGPEEGRVDVVPTERLTPVQGETLEAALKRSPSVVFVGRQG